MGSQAAHSVFRSNLLFQVQISYGPEKTKNITQNKAFGTLYTIVTLISSEL